jgi:hypothetical protein
VDGEDQAHVARGRGAETNFVGTIFPSVDRVNAWNRLKAVTCA